MLQVLTLEYELPEWNKFICEEICGQVFYAEFIYANERTSQNFVE